MSVAQAYAEFRAGIEAELAAKRPMDLEGGTITSLNRNGGTSRSRPKVRFKRKSGGYHKKIKP